MRRRLRVNEAYDLCLLAFQHAFSVVGKDSLVVDHRNKVNTRLLGTFRVTSNEVANLQSIHASHTLQQSGRVAAEAAASYLLGNESEVALRLIIARNVCKSCARVE